MTNLKRIIDEKGVRQRWLAEQVGVTEVSMSRYVSGERIPKAPLAIRMADVLGVDVKELYGWDDKHVVGEPEQPETHEERTETHACDLIDRQVAIDAIEKNAYRHTYLDQIIDIIKALPSAQPEIVRCGSCKYAEIADARDNQDGYTCQFHRGSIWFSGSYCSWAERRTDERSDRKSKGD